MSSNGYCWRTSQLSAVPDLIFLVIGLIFIVFPQNHSSPHPPCDSSGCGMWAYTLRRRYYLVIGHAPSYGHYKEYSFSSVLEDIETYIKKSELDWSEQGLTFKEKSGHRLFFPKEWFLGGR